MANPLNRFHLSSNVNYSIDVDVDYLPFKNPLGDFERIENIDVLINSWNNILLTPRGTYDHDPVYGSGLFDLIFSPANSDTKSIITDEIYRTLQYYDDRGNISDIDIKFYNNNSYSVTIMINYKGETKPLKLHITQTER